MSVTMIWGAAALVPLVVNWLAHRAERNRFVDSVGLSVMLVLFWAAYNVVITSPPGRPENMIPLVGLDLLGVCVAMAAWVRHHRVYKLILAGVFVSQLVIHMAFWLVRSGFWLAWSAAGFTWSGFWLALSGSEFALKGHALDQALYAYMACLNATFALQLLTVAFPGGRALVRRYISVGLGFWGRHIHLGSGRR